MGSDIVRVSSLFFGCLLVGATSAVYSISFAAIIYNGDLGAFLDRGIGLTLIGASVMAAGGGLLFSLSGTVSHPQDITAVMLAASAANLGGYAQVLSPDALFMTTAALVAVTGLFAGVVAAALGYCRLSRLFQYLPHPVMGGFLAATGYFLLMGALGILQGRSISLQDIPGLWSQRDLATWLPWITIGAAYVVLCRKVRARCVLPIAVAATLAGFFALLALRAVPLSAAQDAGLLLGPFPSDGLLAAYDPSLLGAIHWPLVLGEMPISVSVAVMVVLGGLLNLHGLHHVTGQPVDLDNDLKSVGVLNVFSSMAGGLVGYPAISTTILGWRIGLTGLAAATSAALVCVLLALFGTEVVGMLPKGLFAAIVAYLGMDLLYTWLWREWRYRPTWEFFIVFLILVTAATVGFIQALALGLSAAVACRILFGRNPVSARRPGQEPLEH